MVSLARSVVRLAGLQEDGRVLLQRLALAFAGAGQHQIDAAPRHRMARARLEPEHAGFGAPLGPHAEQLLGHALGALHRRPVVVLRVRGDRRVVAALRIDHLAAVHVLPDRLVGVGVAPAGHVVVAMEDAVLELAERLELLHPGLDLARQQIAGAAGAAELQHRAEDVGLVDLRAVRHAFRVVAEHAGLERAVLAVVGLALDHETVLIEIVPVARAGIVGAEPAQRELEIARRARRPLRHGARMERAAAVLEAAHERGIVKLHDFHGFAPGLVLALRHYSRTARLRSGGAQLP